MYIPKNNQITDQQEMIAFMRQYSFATIVTIKDNCPIASHLPFIVKENEGTVVLTSHFAKANEQWKDIAEGDILVIFSEPHAYISPANYEKELNVPTWNYIAIHAYAKGKLILDEAISFNVLEQTINTYEATYLKQWNSLPQDYKQKMVNGIVVFELAVHDLQGKKKLSQNKSEQERKNIIKDLSSSNDYAALSLANHMQEDL
jgi:transcriptional regulator